MSEKNTSAQLLIAGAFSGFAEAIVVQPLYMIKTRFQLNSSKNVAISSAMRNIIREGGILRFYRGLLPEMAGMMPKTSLMMWTYDVSKYWLTQRWGVPIPHLTSNDVNQNSSTTVPLNKQATLGIVFAAGLLSGYAEAITVTPFQVVKIRLQTKEYLGLYKNSFDYSYKILTQEGIRALSTGLGPTCWRNCVWNSIYFALMFDLKDRLPRSKSKTVDLLQTLVTGTVGGIVATTFNAPFDVAKSRIQSQLPGQKIKKYRWTLQSLMLIYREEGAAAIYKGYQPKVLRMALGGGVVMTSYELACYLMQPTHLRTVRG